MLTLAERLRNVEPLLKGDLNWLNEVWPEVCAVVETLEGIATDRNPHAVQAVLDALARRMDEEGL